MKRSRLLTVVCVLALVVLFALPLWLDSRRSGDEERFVGTDATATEMVEESDPGYRPWFQPFFAPSGGEVESGLFALQAAVGAGVLGYALGAMRGRKRGREEALAAASAAVPVARPTALRGVDAARPSAGSGDLA